MAIITNDQIKDISVKTVQDFLNHKIPLSAGLAKQASVLELNSEQIKRAVEATNCIAHLKILEMVSDRTVEFDLCKEAEVMQHIVLPQGLESLPAEVSPIIDATNIEKMASAPSLEVDLNKEAFGKMSEHELTLHFIKEAATNNARIQVLEDDAAILMSNINASVKSLRSDDSTLEKLAARVSGDDFAQLSTILYGEIKEHKVLGLYKVAEIKHDFVAIDKLNGMVKEAQELNTELTRRKDLHAQSELIKQAFLGALGGAIGRTIGSVAGGAIGAVSKAIGGATARSAANVGAKAADKVRTVMGKAPLSKPVQKFGIGALGAGAASVALDASMYRPGNSPDTGKSKDVWDALQR